MQVYQVLANKSIDAIFSITKETTVFHALELMAEKNIGAVLVLEDGELIGIFSERDYARKLILKGKSSKDTLIRELMTENPVTVTMESSIDDCMQIMSSKRIRHLPVVEGEKPIGMISIGDVVKELIADRESMIANLENYMFGR